MSDETIRAQEGTVLLAQLNLAYDSKHDDLEPMLSNLKVWNAGCFRKGMMDIEDYAAALRWSHGRL